MPKQIPEFQNEDEEREFWAKQDSTDYLDWEQAERVVFPKLKPATKTISLRMSESMLNELKLLANKMDAPATLVFPIHFQIFGYLRFYRQGLYHLVDNGYPIIYNSKYNTGMERIAYHCA